MGDVLSGPVWDTHVAQDPFEIASQMRGSHAFCLVFVWYRAITAEITLLYGGYHTSSAYARARGIAHSEKTHTHTHMNKQFCGIVRAFLGILLICFLSQIRNSAPPKHIKHLLPPTQSQNNFGNSKRGLTNRGLSHELSQKIGQKSFLENRAFSELIGVWSVSHLVLGCSFSIKVAYSP